MLEDRRLSGSGNSGSLIWVLQIGVLLMSSFTAADVISI